MAVTRRRWSVDLDGRRRTIELEHRTWWQRAIVRVDGVVAANQSINLALGYDRAATLSASVDGHRVEVTIRADGAIRPTYRYGIRVDGAPVAGSDDVLAAPARSAHPTVLGIAEQIIWASVLIAAARMLPLSPLLSIALVPAAVVASWILRRRTMPAAWRLLGAVLVTVWWIVAAAALTAASDGPRGA